MRGEGSDWPFLGKRLAFLLFAVMTTVQACATHPSSSDIRSKGERSARILLVERQFDIAQLLFNGMEEYRPDWSAAASTNMQSAVEATLKGKSHSYKALDPSTAMEGRNGQLLRLNGAVGTSIQVFAFLPTKRGGFDWTLGEGARALGETYDADYALFVYGRGSYSSGARVAAMIGMAALGVSIPMGGQQVFASLVDLKTGQVVWFNQSLAGPNADMRTPEGAILLTESMLKGLPL